MNRRRHTGLRSHELVLIRLVLLLGVFVGGCQSLVVLIKGVIRIGRANPSVFTQSAEPVRYWLFTGLTFLPLLIAGAAFFWSFSPRWKAPDKPRGRAAPTQA